MVITVSRGDQGPNQPCKMTLSTPCNLETAEKGIFTTVKITGWVSKQLAF